jgi:O-antigen/teichoic acid export membrane protein
MSSALPQSWLQYLNRDNQTVRAYLSLITGSAGRLVISLAYFVAIANALSLADFGLFATASAVGVLLSRLLAFGFVSPLYRVATVKRRLLGTYSAGLLGGALASLPLVALVAAAVHLTVFSGEMSGVVFVMMMAAEIVFWRGFEIVIIVLNGLNRFARGALLLILGTALRACAAVAFAMFGDGSLHGWVLLYLAANIVCFLVAAAVFYPPVRLRWQPRLYARRWVDAVSVASAEVLFYLQSELDKVLVLAIGGPATAGIYAIVMRLIDLTALPVRSGFTLLVQKLMVRPDLIAGRRNRIGFELAVVAVSTAGIAAMAIFLHIFPNALGENVAEAGPLLLLVIGVPALRNLIEYHSELLYATGRTVLRALNLALLAIAKAVLLTALLTNFAVIADWAIGLNPVFIALYALSALLTYGALKNPARRAI